MNGAVDLDIYASPFTNTIAIKRLALKRPAIGNDSSGVCPSSGSQTYISTATIYVETFQSE
jgi:hypothetical protein